MSLSLPWLAPSEPFPDPGTAWGALSPAPGLLAAGGALDVQHLREAYAQGIFPWFSDGQPILWWSPDPRMVMPLAEFRLHRSLRRVLQKFRQDGRCEIRVNHAFGAVIQACARTERPGQGGTWIVSDMVAAYTRLHLAGNAHSVETWVDGDLVGGLYCVSLGQAVFGESMFAASTDASKIALAALVCLCRRQGVQLIDCQQNTRHLASLGAREIPRMQFIAQVQKAQKRASLQWNFESLYWNELLSPPCASA